MFMGGSGTTTANGGLTIASNTNLGLNDTRTLRNAGAASWTGAFSFSNDASATLVNLPAGTFSIETAADFFGALRRGATSHVEIETYTWDVLREAERRAGTGPDLVRVLTREYEHVLGVLAAHGVHGVPGGEGGGGP